jgi:hypothetical protein
MTWEGREKREERGMGRVREDLRRHQLEWCVQQRNQPILQSIHPLLPCNNRVFLRLDDFRGVGGGSHS